MKISRQLISRTIVGALALFLLYSFWPGAVGVDIGEVSRQTMMVTIDEQGRTQAHEVYLVSTPVAGQLLRVDVEPGDRVMAGESVVAKMRPANPTLLDSRNKAQAEAALGAAQASMRLAKAEHERAIADKELADTQLQRVRELKSTDAVSQLDLDRALHESRVADAALHNAQALMAVKQAEIFSTRALLSGFSVDKNAADDEQQSVELSVFAPANGQVLRVLLESETNLPVGTPIMEIGDIDHDLEVVVELLSSDAVQVSSGDRVILKDWGGEQRLNGVVDRIDPSAFTKVSALGVEEQRVNTVISFDDPEGAGQKLGHNYRIEVRIIVWQDDDALVVPASALFRDADRWAVFVVDGSSAHQRQVQIGQNNGVMAQVEGGLSEGERVVLYPSPELTDGVRVRQRTLDNW